MRTIIRIICYFFGFMLLLTIWTGGPLAGLTLMGHWLNNVNSIMARNGGQG
jgi:hypothetical protein